MKAERVHGGGEVLLSMAERFGLRGQYGPVASYGWRGMATLSGRDGTNSVISAGLSSEMTCALSLESENSCDRVGDETMEVDVVFNLSSGRLDFRVLMLFQMPRDARRVGRCRSSLWRVQACGCERRWKASLAGEGKQRHGMLTASEGRLCGGLYYCNICTEYVEVCGKSVAGGARTQFHGGLAATQETVECRFFGEACFPPRAASLSRSRPA
jgi:hypothetical protein